MWNITCRDQGFLTKSSFLNINEYKLLFLLSNRSWDLFVPVHRDAILDVNWKRSVGDFTFILIAT